METPVHVCVRPGAVPLRVLLLDLLHRLTGSEEVGVGLDALGEGRGVGVKHFGGLPCALHPLFNVYEIVAFVGLDVSDASTAERTFSMTTTDPTASWVILAAILRGRERGWSREGDRKRADHGHRDSLSLYLWDGSVSDYRMQMPFRLLVVVLTD